MPEKCVSCGELSVVEDDTRYSNDKICTECGTVATGLGASQVSTTTSVRPENSISEQKICDSCGDVIYTSESMCPECLDLRSDSLDLESETNPDADVCKSCGSTNLDFDTVGVDEYMVCRDCGTLIKNDILVNDELSSSKANTFTSLPKNGHRSRKLRGKAAGHSKISFLHKKFSLPDNIREEAKEMFDEVFLKPHIYRMRIDTKEHLAAACVFFVCRKHDMPISLVHFQKYVEKFPVFLKSKKILLNCLNVNLPHMKLTCQAENLLSERGFSSRFISKVKDILFLCRQAWLTQGRSREGLIIIAAYYAYISSQNNINMKKFCQMYSFPMISLILQAECKKFFLKLASRIPWATKTNIKPTTIHKYIDDILKYQNSLFHLTFMSPDDASQEEVSSHRDQTPKQKNTRGSKTARINKRMGGDVKQKEYLLPPILKKPKRKVYVTETRISSSVDLDSPDVKESEFDEAEITSYLLTPEEEVILRTPKLQTMSK